MIFLTWWISYHFKSNNVYFVSFFLYISDLKFSLKFCWNSTLLPTLDFLYKIHILGLPPNIIAWHIGIRGHVRRYYNCTYGYKVYYTKYTGHTIPIYQPYGYVPLPSILTLGAHTCFWGVLTPVCVCVCVFNMCVLSLCVHSVCVCAQCVCA